ncbi:protein kinase superfamily protein [Actinidia rufa]|uniref:Protein kinase superfamily protein n=1 Tax=Actinidia rufa TaxID=165716 RepID=A0A7J0FIK6_9ERIC|nr:protein kinase superfamily protein [Actinidia rufa]
MLISKLKESDREEDYEIGGFEREKKAIVNAELRREMRRERLIARRPEEADDVVNSVGGWSECHRVGAVIRLEGARDCDTWICRRELVKAVTVLCTEEYYRTALWPFVPVV